MANHKSAKKQNKQSIVRSRRNRCTISKVKTFIKKVLESVAAKDHAAAIVCMRETESQIMKAVKKKVLKLNTASRKVSNLTRKIKAISQESAGVN